MSYIPVSLLFPRGLIFILLVFHKL